MASLNVNSSITLNVARPNSNVVVYAKQYDMATRVVNINLISGNAVWDPPNGCEMIALFDKPDGTKCIYDVVENYPQYSAEETYEVGDRVIRTGYAYQCISDITTPEAWNSNHWTSLGAVTPAIVRTGTGAIRLTLAEQALAAAGNVLAEISFYTESQRITTLSFILAVEKSVPDNDTFRSDNYFNVLSELIQGLLGASVHPPIINPVNYLWQYWNTATGQYEDNTDGLSGKGDQGDQGERGFSVSGITLISGNHDPGTNDTYRVDLNNGENAGTFQVYNGQDGYGADPGDRLPLPDGEASAGTAHAYARADHVHPAVATQAIFDAIYPVGSVYMSMNPTSPSLLFGGDWVKIENVFLFGAGDAASVRSYGGNPTVTINISLPQHNHNLATKTIKYGTLPSGSNNMNSLVDWGSANATDTAKNTSTTGSSASSTEFSIMPPYLAVYMGERVQLIDYDNNMAFVKGNFYVEAGNTNIYRCNTGSGGQIATASLSTYVGSFLTVVNRW